MSRFKVLWADWRDRWRQAGNAAYLMRGGASIGLPRRIEGRQFIRIGRYTRIQPGCWLGAYTHYGDNDAVYSPEIVISEGVYIGHMACITAIRSVEIGPGTMISEFFYTSDHTHGNNPRLGSPIIQPLVSKGSVKIGENCSIGLGASVLPGVELGASCVVAAGAVVTKSFMANSMIAGTPARLIKRFDVERGEWVPASV